MKIAYVTHTRFPTEKAHGVQIAHVCHALAELGHGVTLIQPTVWNAIQEDPFTYYGLPPSFAIQKLEHFDAQKARFIPGPLRFAVNMWLYRRALRQEGALERFDILYCRNFLILPPLLHGGRKVIFEIHSLPRFGKKIFASQCNRCAAVVCLTSLMRDELVSWGVDPKRILVEGDSVDLSRFTINSSKPEAKKKYGLPADIPVLGYAGSLVTRDIEKGVRHIIEAAAVLKKRNIRVFTWIVGGPMSQVTMYREQATEQGLPSEDIRFEGVKPSQEIPKILRACDVLVYPAPASTNPYFQRDTSPLKLFEYMAAGIPIVCADLPPLRDVVDESCVTFCTPGDGTSLADAVERVLLNPEEAAKKASISAEKVKHHTWIKRMERILRRL